MIPENDFYFATMKDLLKRGFIRKEHSILIICGGKYDKDVMQSLSLTNVLISNLDRNLSATEFHPFSWSYQNAESLSFTDKAFDFCIAHSGLHHCYSPHRALLEMYRVSRKGIIVFEPYDSLLTRIGLLFKIGQEFEHAAVFYNDMQHGGVENSEIPNYIYRWTEKEIIKTISSYAPYAEHRFEFVHKIRIPWIQLKGRKNRLIIFFFYSLYPLLLLASKFFPKQCNNFAAIVLHNDLDDFLFPWLSKSGDYIKVNKEYLAKKYRKI